MSICWSPRPARRSPRRRASCSAARAAGVWISPISWCRSRRTASARPAKCSGPRRRPATRSEISLLFAPIVSNWRRPARISISASPVRPGGRFSSSFTATTRGSRKRSIVSRRSFMMRMSTSCRCCLPGHPEEERSTTSMIATAQYIRATRWRRCSRRSSTTAPSARSRFSPTRWAITSRSRP